MANKHFQLVLEVQADATPRTIAQFLVAAGGRVLLHAVEIGAEGATPNSSPLVWALRKQSDAGGLASATAELRKARPVFPGAIATTALKQAVGAEPATDGAAIAYLTTLHQQSSKVWSPPRGPVVMDENERWGWISEDNSTGFAVLYTFHLEE